MKIPLNACAAVAAYTWNAEKTSYQYDERRFVLHGPLPEQRQLIMELVIRYYWNVMNASEEMGKGQAGISNESKHDAIAALDKVLAFATKKAIEALEETANDQQAESKPS